MFAFAFRLRWNKETTLERKGFSIEQASDLSILNIFYVRLNLDVNFESWENFSDY